jgi:hypothetical protein
VSLKDDHLRIALGRRTIVLPHSSSVALIVELRRRGSLPELREALERNEPPERLVLTAAERASLAGFIEDWTAEVAEGGIGMPSGILELRDALEGGLSSSSA